MAIYLSNLVEWTIVVSRTYYLNGIILGVSILTNAFLIWTRTHDVKVLNMRCEQTKVRLPGIRYHLRAEYMVPDHGRKM